MVSFLFCLLHLLERLLKEDLTVLAFAISPDQQLCATVGEDGCLRIIDLVEEK